jgi:hypothetical protein
MPERLGVPAQLREAAAQHPVRQRRAPARLAWNLEARLHLHELLSSSRSLTCLRLPSPWDASWILSARWDNASASV